MNETRVIVLITLIAILTTACGNSGGEPGSDSGDDEVTPPVVVPSPTMAKDILFSEIMVEPALPVNEGEWFEIQNPGTARLNMFNCVFTDDAGGNFSINSELIIEPGGYLIFAISANQPFIPDYIYNGTGLTLSNPADTLYLNCNGIAIDSRNYTLAVRGRSSGLSNNGTGVWCDNLVDRYNATDTGTPGAVNIDC